jgi:hypothetical protein
LLLSANNGDRSFDFCQIMLCVSLN